MLSETATALHVGRSQAWHTKLSITHSFFELQTPDFAWKFVWIVQINYKSTKVQKVQKKVHKYKSTHNSVIFRATDSRFCIEVHMHCPTK